MNIDDANGLYIDMARGLDIDEADHDMQLKRLEMTIRMCKRGWYTFARIALPSSRPWDINGQFTSAGTSHHQRGTSQICESHRETAIIVLRGGGSGERGVAVWRPSQRHSNVLSASPRR